MWIGGQILISDYRKGTWQSGLISAKLLMQSTAELIPLNPFFRSKQIFQNPSMATPSLQYNYCKKFPSNMRLIFSSL